MALFEMYSNRERKALNVAMCCAGVLTAELIIMNLSEGFVRLIQSNDALYIIVITVGSLTTVGALFLYFRMFYHCIFVSNQAFVLKVGWVILFVSLLWVGGMIYFQFVFSRDSRTEETYAE